MAAIKYHPGRMMRLIMKLASLAAFAVSPGAVLSDWLLQADVLSFIPFISCLLLAWRCLSL